MIFDITNNHWFIIISFKLKSKKLVIKFKNYHSSNKLLWFLHSEKDPFGENTCVSVIMQAIPLGKINIFPSVPKLTLRFAHIRCLYFAIRLENPKDVAIKHEQHNLNRQQQQQQQRETRKTKTLNGD